MIPADEPDIFSFEDAEKKALASIKQKESERKSLSLKVEKSVQTAQTETTTIELKEERQLEPAEKPVIQNTTTKVISFIPDDPPELKELAEKCVMAYGQQTKDDDLIQEGQDVLDWIENLFPKLASRVEFHRMAKQQVDQLLTDWVLRNKPAFKHLGVHSKTIAELWPIVHRMLFDSICHFDEIKQKREEELRQTLYKSYDKIRELGGIP